MRWVPTSPSQRPKFWTRGSAKPVDFPYSEARLDLGRCHSGSSWARHVFLWLRRQNRGSQAGRRGFTIRGEAIFGPGPLTRVWMLLSPPPDRTISARPCVGCAKWRGRRARRLARKVDAPHELWMERTDPCMANTPYRLGLCYSPSVFYCQRRCLTGWANGDLCSNLEWFP